MPSVSLIAFLKSLHRVSDRGQRDGQESRIPKEVQELPAVPREWLWQFPVAPVGGDGERDLRQPTRLANQLNLLLPMLGSFLWDHSALKIRPIIPGNDDENERLHGLSTGR